MARKWLFVILMMTSVVGIAWAQSVDPPLFIFDQQIGERRPGGIRYNPHFDQLAWVDLQGRLTLVDAATYQPQHVISSRGGYNAYQFSHDGRYLALAIDRRIELWNAQTGELSASFEPDGANLVQGPLIFSQDDSWLLLDTVVPAPQATRRSENDTDIIPWIWDLPAARNEAPERLRGGAEAFAFFNYRNGLVMAGDLFLVAGQPERLQLIDGRSRNFPVINEFPASLRAEQDPIFVWQSAISDLMYVGASTDGSSLQQVDTQTGDSFNIPLGRDLNYRNLDSLQNLRLGGAARVLCGLNTMQETPLLRLLFGEGYLRFQGYQPTTYALIDVIEPLSTGATTTALILYNIVESRGIGSIEVITLPDTLQLRLSPDGTRLMVRRASGVQPIEIYNLDTCGLERIIYPAEFDDTGTRLLEYRADGEVIVADFQRFDARTGAQLAYEPQYTAPFEEHRFSDDGQRLHTFRAGELSVWDIGTRQLLQHTRMQINGEILDRSPDGTHFLTRYEDEASIILEQTSVLGGERRQLRIPFRAESAIVQIIPSPGWGRALVVHQLNRPADNTNSLELAIYDFAQGQLLYIAGDDLPPSAFEFGWVDDDRIYAAGANRPGFDRQYGLDYHSSGLPTCLVNAFPEDYTAWLPAWEGLTLRLDSSQLASLTRRICAALPDSAADFLPGLTPTPRFTYNSLNTPIPFAIPGVPICLTSRFANQAVDFAALWRGIIADLDADQVALMETMICEGLINSPFQVAATPTIDPNLNVPPTPTAVAGGPAITDFTETGDTRYLTIDVRTGDRFSGTYPPERVRPPRPDANQLYGFYRDQFNADPLNPVISLDGSRYAVTNGNGFVSIYGLTRTYDQLLEAERLAEATRQADAPLSIGLAPTATQPYSFAGEVRPTLTPTVTPSPPALPQANPAAPQVTDFCPVRQLYTLQALPPDFAATGRIFAFPPPSGFAATWVLEPETGSYTADDALPRCPLNGNCSFSPDGGWMLQVAELVTVSRPDGSQSTTLFSPEEINYFPQSFRWINNRWLEYQYPGFINDELAARILAERGEQALRQFGSGQISLTRIFDVTTGERSQPFLPPPLDLSIEGLPTSLISRQPGDGPLFLLATPYPPFGIKLYLYDLRTGDYDYFLRADDGNLFHEWSPDGRYLYYRLATSPAQFVYDTASGQHRRMRDLPGGTWSRDGRYRINWGGSTPDEYQAQLAARELPFKITLWDSQTDTFRRYCLPESGIGLAAGSPFFWSPDGRYVAFSLQLPPEGDVFPVPTPEMGIITPQANDPFFATQTPSIDMLPSATPPPPGMESPTLAPDAVSVTLAPDMQSITTPNPAVALEQQYQYRNPRTLILDVQTGSVILISTEAIGGLYLWTDDGGAR
jgi:WD40 repeat protein